MGWLIAYLIIGAILGIVGYLGMRKDGKSVAKSLKMGLLLVLFWPIMYGSVILAALLFRNIF